MSDSPFDRFQPQEPASTQSPFDRFQSQPIPERASGGRDTTLEEYQRLDSFVRMMRAQDLLRRSQTDPSIGDPHRLADALDDARQEFMRETGLSRQDADDLARQSIAVTPIDRWDGAMNPATNALMAAGGLLQPAMIAGDAARSFPAQLAEVQLERDLGVTGLRDIDAGRTGTFSGSPAGTPWQAAQELVLAGGRTMEQLMGNGGWVHYLPSLTWGGKSVTGNLYDPERAVTGQQFNERFGINERLGLESEEAQMWAGLATEVLTDPWLAADFLFAGARIMRAAGRVGGKDRFVRSAVKMEDAAEDLYRSLSPIGLARGLVGGADTLSFGGVGIALRAVDRGVNAVLDIPAPRWLNRAGQDWAQGVQGAAEFQPLLRDVLFQGGAPTWLSRTRPEGFTGSPVYGQSIGDLAYASGQYVASMGLRGAERIQGALTDGLTITANLRWRSPRVSISAARVVPEKHQGYVRGLGQIVSELADTVGPSRPGIPQEFADRIKQLARAHGYTDNGQDAMQRVRKALDETRRLVLQSGYAASGYSEVTVAMRRAANAMGEDYSTLRRAYERERGGLDLQTLEARDFFPTNPARMSGSVAPDADDIRRAAELRVNAREGDLFDRFETAIRQELRVMNRADLAQLDFARFLTGMRDGYLRRMFVGVQDPTAGIEALRRRDMVVVRNVDSAELSQRFATEFGQEVQGPLESLLEALTPGTPRGYQAPEGQAAMASLALRTDDVARIVARETGKRVSPEDIARVVYGANGELSDYAYLKETLSILESMSGQASVTGTGGAPFARPAGFARQDLSPEQLVQRLQLFDPMQQGAEVAMRAARSVRAQEMLAGASDELRRLGLMMDRDALIDAIARGHAGLGGKGALENMDAWAAYRRALEAGQDAAPPAQGMFSFTNANGERWVVVPNSPKRWGPMAGQAIPEDIARLTTYAMQYSRHDQGAYGRLLSMWRRGLLAPLSTSLRNVGGNFLLMQQAGLPILDLVANIPRANRLRREFLETGRLPEYLRGYEPQFTFINETTRTAQATRTIDEQIRRQLGRSTPGSAGQLMDFLDDAIDSLTHIPPAGFLSLFRYGEELTRTSAFLTTYDHLTRRGVHQAEAVRRASHMAANAAYNYGALPLGPDMLRRTGLTAFPQFTYFTVGRTARALLERPGVFARTEYARQAANMALVGTDPDEHKSISEMSADWLKNSFPMALPIFQEDGLYGVFNTDYWFPQGSNILDMLTEPTQAGWLAPLIDTAFALRDGSGQGPVGQRFGQQVFDPAESGIGRLGQAAGYVASQMILPGLGRTVRQLGDAVDYNIGRPSPDFPVQGWVGTLAEGAVTGEMFQPGWWTQNKESMDLLGLAQTRYFNSDWSQFFLRQVGVGTQKVDVTGRISFRQREADINREYDNAARSIRKQMDAEAMRSDRDQDRMDALIDRLAEIEVERGRAIADLARAIR